MGKAMKILFFGSAFAVALMVLWFLFLLVLNGFSLTALAGGEFKTEEHEISDGFQNISLNTKTGDITLLPSEDGKCRVVCYEREKTGSLVTLLGDTLVVKPNDTRAWYEKMFSFGNAKITLYLPQREYSALTVSGSTGDVKINDGINVKTLTVTQSTGDVVIGKISVGEASVTVSTGDILLNGISSEKDVKATSSTGDITLKNINCGGDIEVKLSTGDAVFTDVFANSIITSASTGDAALTGVKARGDITLKRSTGVVKLTDTVCEKLSVTTDTGDVRLTKSDAKEISIHTDTGDVSGSLLSEKVFITKTGTGRVSVPKTTEGGQCQITTDTGNIRISIFSE